MSIDPEWLKAYQKMNIQKSQAVLDWIECMKLEAEFEEKEKESNEE